MTQTLFSKFQSYSEVSVSEAISTSFASEIPEQRRHKETIEIAIQKHLILTVSENTIETMKK